MIKYTFGVNCAPNNDDGIYSTIIVNTIKLVDKLHGDILKDFVIFVDGCEDERKDFSYSRVSYLVKGGDFNGATITLYTNINNDEIRARVAKYIALISCDEVTDDDVIIRTLLHELAHILFIKISGIGDRQADKLREASTITEQYPSFKRNDILLNGNSIIHSLDRGELWAELYATQYFNYYRNKLKED